jgi:RNA recognition motif-containing protein
MWSAPEGQIYITGLPPTVTDEALADYFGSLGIIKVDKRKGTPMVRVPSSHCMRKVLLLSRSPCVGMDLS